jgi:hypothetical protein
MPTYNHDPPPSISYWNVAFVFPELPHGIYLGWQQTSSERHKLEMGEVQTLEGNMKNGVAAYKLLVDGDMQTG